MVTVAAYDGYSSRRLSSCLGCDLNTYTPGLISILNCIAALRGVAASSTCSYCSPGQYSNNQGLVYIQGYNVVSFQVTHMQAIRYKLLLSVVR